MFCSFRPVFTASRFIVDVFCDLKITITAFKTDNRLLSPFQTKQTGRYIHPQMIKTTPFLSRFLLSQATKYENSTNRIHRTITLETFRVNNLHNTATAHSSNVFGAYGLFYSSPDAPRWSYWVLKNTSATYLCFSVTVQLRMKAEHDYTDIN